MVMPTNAGGTNSSLRWETEEAVRAWEREGSTMIGPWPLPLQDQWKEDIMLLEAKSNTETSELSRQLAEVTATFNSYKSRAQTGQRSAKYDFLQFPVCACQFCTPIFISH